MSRTSAVVLFAFLFAASPVVAELGAADTTPPVLALSPVSALDTRQPIFGGFTDEPGTITIAIGEIHETFAAGTAWSYRLRASLPANGPYTASVIATDLSGNASAPLTVSFVVVPACTVTFPASPFDSANHLAGTAEIDSTVFIALGNDASPVTVPNNGGSWTYDLPANLADGPVTVYVWARDAAGYGGKGSSFSFFLDRTPPAKPVITAPLDGSLHLSHNVTIAGSADDDTFVTLKVNGASIASSRTLSHPSFSLPYIFNTDGTYTLTVVPTDRAGNFGPESDPVIVTMDDRVNLLVTASVSTAVFGQSITYTAVGTYVATGARIPNTFPSGGLVVFRPGGSASIVDGRASETRFANDPLPDVTATYTLGTAVCCANTVHVALAPAATTMALRRSGDTFLASVVAVAPSFAFPSGNVSLRVNATTYTAPLVDRVATFHVPAGSAPENGAVATYDGNSRFLPSSASLAIAAPARRRAAGH